MRYIDVQWFHENTHDPVRLVSELDDEGFERRKLEFFRGGEVGAADGGDRRGDTRLGEASVQPLEEINSDPQFRATEIDRSRFEALWREHAQLTCQSIDLRTLVVHLERPYASYQSELVPARELVVTGLSWPTEYWAGLAIAWLEQGAPIDGEVVALLHQVAKKKNFAQGIRHRASSLARRWERKHNGA